MRVCECEVCAGGFFRSLLFGREVEFLVNLVSSSDSHSHLVTGTITRCPCDRELPSPAARRMSVIQGRTQGVHLAAASSSRFRFGLRIRVGTRVWEIKICVHIPPCLTIRFTT